MKRLTRLDRLVMTAVVAVVAALPLAQPALAGLEGPDVPPKIQVEEGNKVFLKRHAIGVQIYACNPTTGGSYAWGFVAPRADLYDSKGTLRGTHYAGPTWKDQDGSTVKATRVDGVPGKNGAIPELLLKKSTASAGDDGDRLLNTTFIQRVATTGGAEPPAADCNAETSGTREEVPYTADYYFWKSTGH